MKNYSLFSIKTKYILPKMVIILLLLTFAIFIIVPLMWMFSTTLRMPTTSFALPPKIFPTEFRLDSYKIVFEKVPFAGFFINSIKVAIIVTGLQLLISSMAAYAFSRLEFPGKHIIFLCFLATLMIPAQVTNIPQFIFMSKLRLINTHAALILPSIFSPLAIFLIRTYMLSIPKSMDEAAYMDGANRVWTYWHIVLPMSRSSLIVVGLLTFIGSWNDFYRPLIFINDTAKMTLPLGMTALRGMLGTGNQSALLAGVMLLIIAPLLFYLFGQRYLLEGVNIGGLKG